MNSSTTASESIAVLFVCMGNICRSPTAQGMFEKLLEDGDPSLNVTVDSAGTNAHHQGQPPDRRAQAALERLKIDISGQRARAVVEQDFHRFDFILAMDKDNLLALKSRRAANSKAHVCLFMDYAPERSPKEVPDPYYGGQSGFTEVITLVDSACRGFLNHLITREPVND